MSCSRMPKARRRSSSCFSFADEIGKRAMTDALGFVFDLECFIAQRPMDVLNMLGAGGFQDQFDFGLADRHLAEAAAMTDLQNVSPEFGNALSEAREAAGPIRDHN